MPVIRTRLDELSSVYGNRVYSEVESDMLRRLVERRKKYAVTEQDDVPYVDFSSN